MPASSAEPLVRLACCVISQIVKPNICAFWQPEFFNMVTERHNIASGLIIKTLSQGKSGRNIIFTGIGWSMDGLTKSGFASTCSQQDLTQMASTKYSRWTSILLKTRWCLYICTLLVENRNSNQSDIQAVRPLRWNVHLVLIKYRGDTRLEQ